MQFKRAIAGLMVVLSILLLPSCNDSGASKDINSSSTETTAEADAVVQDSEMDISEFEFYPESDGSVYSVMRGSEQPKHKIMKIPEEYNGCKVVEILGEGFKLVEKFNTLIIPDTVNKIGKNAFSFCPDLVTVEMGNGVEELGQSAFLGCEKLKNLTLSEKLTELPMSAFQNCAVEKVNIPSSVTSIKENVFALCKNLKEVHISASVTEIADTNGPFEGCPDLTIYAPAGSYAEEYAKSHGITFSAE